ncbi:hypothetical protein WQ54_27815 [Bacillus sp. SA1-12]|nr:hypothetical protein WQ54_27815 [Bacillus sp. SA1-12]
MLISRGLLGIHLFFTSLLKHSEDARIRIKAVDFYRKKQLFRIGKFAGLHPIEHRLIRFFGIRECLEDGKLMITH